MPGKDYTLDRHEDNPIAAQMLFYDVTGKWRERETKEVVAYVHVTRSFSDRIKQGNQGIKGEKRDPSTIKFNDEKEKDDYVAQHQTGLYTLDTLYMISVREKVSFLRFTAEIWETYGSEMKDKFRDWLNKTENYFLILQERKESFLEWLVLTDDGLEIACKVIRQKSILSRSRIHRFWKKTRYVSINH